MQAEASVRPYRAHVLVPARVDLAEVQLLLHRREHEAKGAGMGKHDPHVHLHGRRMRRALGSED